MTDHLIRELNLARERKDEAHEAWFIAAQQDGGPHPSPRTLRLFREAQAADRAHDEAKEAAKAAAKKIAENAE